ncbi:methyl-accepting chemotaxis protein [Comamonas sp. 17RB]|uniref:methyl-accepting chemotaxis protein n=1 Tax=Comamonas sp. 17RB TaxID=3047025 RepID=UPI0024B6C953|nr:methyl-accepting chemotaxis protein [Comamonas sp. 17RB]MDI9854933.1 methyl-accepting chemotaxis protein [Comamonas sp. 17RB]
MQNWKISTRLAAAFGMLVVVLLGVAGAALLQLSTLNAATKQITGNNLISVELINKLGADMIEARLLELRHVYNESPEYKASIEQQMGKLQADMNDIKARYAPLVYSEAERSAYDTLLAQRKEYVVLMERLFQMSRSGENDKAREFMNGESLQLYNASSATLNKLLEINTNDANNESRKADAAFSNGVWVMGVAVLLALALAVISGIWITRSIRRPLQLAVALADKVAGGDLNNRIDVRTTDELGQLFAALQRMQSSLAETVRVVRRNAEGVASASSQIANGNADLSSRTEEQASSLEETAASMEELGSTVRLNAENAREANQLARTAADVAVHGGDVVGEVVTTMRGINDSSRKIADIVGVIDSIAFQTNILALNAAVEAARAGEQGRGFAVVASEVRSLASRSAAAAKEIAALISESVGRVEQGTVLVDKAGNTMTEVVDSIQKVTAIVGEISTASAEQSQGVTQVGEAVSQMDTVTQQNAALVEESAAAADSLRRQAQELLQAVEVFRLSDSEVHHGASSASAAFAVVPAQPPSVGSRGRVLGLGLRKKAAATAVAADVF